MRQTLLVVRFNQDLATNNVVKSCERGDHSGHKYKLVFELNSCIPLLKERNPITYARLVSVLSLISSLEVCSHSKRYGVLHPMCLQESHQHPTPVSRQQEKLLLNTRNFSTKSQQKHIPSLHTVRSNNNPAQC